MVTWQALAWHIPGIIVLCVLFLDWDWKRRLFETYEEKWTRSPKFREKQNRKYWKMKEEQDRMMAEIEKRDFPERAK